MLHIHYTLYTHSVNTFFTDYLQFFRVFSFSAFREASAMLHIAIIKNITNPTAATTTDPMVMNTLFQTLLFMVYPFVQHWIL